MTARAAITALLLLLASCATTPKCEEACTHLSGCHRSSQMLCTKSCTEQMSGPWQDREALAAATQCVLAATCEELAGGTCAAESFSIY